MPFLLIKQLQSALTFVLKLFWDYFWLSQLQTTMNSPFFIYHSDIAALTIVLLSCIRKMMYTEICSPPKVVWSDASSYIQFINMLHLGYKFVPRFHIIIYFINLHKFWLQRLCRILLPFSTNCVAKTIWTEMKLTSDNIALLVKGLLSNFILKEKVLSAIF